MKLTKQSKQLMTFFFKNKHFNYHPPTAKTKSIVMELYNEIKEAQQYVRHQLLPYKISLKRVSSVSQITKPRYFNANSFPDSVRKHIDETTMSEISFSFSLFEREITVLFISEKDNVDDELEVCTNYMESISMWLYMLNTYASKECATSITIYLYLTSLEKNLPTSNISVLDEKNVNTAFTTSCPVRSEIVVFRKEEWFKVLIHETFHNFGLDFSTMSSRVVDKCILGIFQVHSHVNAYEAYTEFWAEVINALFCAFYSTKNDKDFLSTFDVYINFERTYSLFQMVKTLQFMGLTYSDLLSNSEHVAVKRENLYKEKTNVLAYYVLKSILLNNYQGFIQWCNTHNLSLLQFKKTTGNLTQFCEFIRKNHKTSSILEGINESQAFLSLLSREKKHRKKDILSNMRMSILELG
jgi:hypothetical protein